LAALATALARTCARLTVRTGPIGRRYTVLDVVSFEEKDESPFVGLLQVEAV
jgi:hypothetical protein